MSIVVLLISCCMAGLYQYHAINLVIFTIESLDRDAHSGGEIVIEMRMKTWNTVYDVVCGARLRAKQR